MHYLSISAGKGLLAFAFALGLGMIALPPAQAQTYSVMYTFMGGSDGGTPLAGLVIDSAGNLYGTTSAGGTSGAGTVFKVTSSGEQVLYNFTGGADGSAPEASLLVDASGNIYGTTYYGGSSGNGTVFEIESTGTEKTIYSFKGGTDGANPESALIKDSSGRLYGTTYSGGAYGGGTVFRVSQAGKETILYSFGQSGDGANPVAALAFGPKSEATLYGTTAYGGSANAGTVFELAESKTGWKETLLYQFQLQNDGGNPYASVIFGPSGHIYGAATNGGAGGDSGGGTVFELARSSGTWKFSVLARLPGWGISGSFRKVFMDASGNIWGTTHCDGTNSNGSIYEVTHAAGKWTYNETFDFPSDGSAGYYVFSNLVFDKSGNMYGTASQGGAPGGNGVVFKMTP